MEKTTKKEPKRLSSALRNFFGVGDAGFVLMSNIETFYFMDFLTGLGGFTPVIAGLINSVFSTVDACLSWIYGGILNGTKAKKWGRYRSWLILTPWIVPFLFAFQFIRISDNAMSSSRATWNNIGGLLFSYMGLPFATLLAGIVGEKNQYAAAAFCLGILMALGYFAHFKMTEGYEEIEDANHAKAAQTNKTSIPEMFRSLFQNPQLLILMVADLAKWCVKFVTAASAIYYFRDAMGNPGYMKGYAFSIAVGAIIGAYVVRFLVHKFDARTITIGAYIGMTVFLFLIYIFYSNAYVVIALMTIAQFFYGMAFASSPALYADTVVYATWKTGKNAAGWIMGLQNLPLKVGVFLRGVILAACLSAVGWQSGAVLEGAARQGMTVAFALVPAIFCAAGALLLIFGYRLTRERIAQYQAEIDARN